MNYILILVTATQVYSVEWFGVESAEALSELILLSRFVMVGLNVVATQ